MTAPLVAIIGRPNVGKSTFFNRVLGQRRAVVHDRPGVTRDRNTAHASWNGREFVLVDTGGFLPRAAQGMDAVIRRQAELALDHSAMVLFMVDAQTGPTDMDADIGRLLRRRGLPAIVVVNKVDRPASLDVHEFHRLGLGDPFAISSEQGYGVGDLLDRVVQLLPPPGPDEAAEDVVSVAIVGRPNVGKSSLVNALVGEERVIVDAKPGTTVDAIDTPWRTALGRFVLVDTAGIRKEARFREDTEFFATLRALQALERAHVAALVVDATQGFQRQDMRLANQALEAGRPLLLLYNKWDLIEGRDEAWKRQVRERSERYPHLADVPAVPVSASAGIHLGRLPALIQERAQQGARKIPTPKLNRWLQDVQRRHAAPANAHGRAPRLYYMTQTRTRPPEFSIFANAPSLVGDNYRRYLWGQFTEAFGFRGCPVRLHVKKST